ncbi:penicillin-binding protein [Metabacillus herbersteinensis]|uniref:serine-type D-Ala-D-Ala carboxypeptidase n=1 Tax=Metabacillus herbersteinensis TaxID=283816 RepID=A0ABV6GBZ8_9BACI
MSNLTKKNTNMNRGAALLSLIFALLFFILIARFFYIQATGTVHGEALAAKAEQQYENQRTIEANRGSILDRRGEVIAEDTSSYTVRAVLDDTLTTDADNPQHVVDPQETAQKLAPLLEMEVSEVEKILTKEAKQVEFGSAGRDISHSIKQKIADLKLPGIGFMRDTKRFYPNGVFASHLIGYAQKQDEDGVTKGMMGIEKSLEKYLVEEDGFLKYEQDRYRWKLPNGNEEITPPKNGSDVYLTIDQKIQTFLEDAMNQVVKEYEPEKIIGIVADPKTGKILAMGQRPGFDPNTRDIGYYYNDAVAYPFEPGSTMKIFTLAAAIEEGVYNGNDTFLSGSFTVGPRIIRDHNKTGWGPITYNEGVQRSSNVAFSIIAKEKLGTDRLYQYFNKFGFQEKTGIDLPNEAGSTINFKTEGDKISTAFGQSIAITPIQQIQAATAIANGGKMMKPYVIDKIVDTDDNEVVKQQKPEVIGQPISENTSKEVLNILETVVSSEKGTGKPYRIEGYEVAGKSGTAQIANPKGGYLTGADNHVFSFLGMAPKENPELLVYVAVQKPKLKGKAGSTPVSMVFNTVMKNSLQYLHIQPSEEIEKKTKQTETKQGEELASYVGNKVGDVTKQLESLNLKVTILGNGQEVISQFPDKGTSIIANERVLVQTSDSIKIPDLIGWSKRDVMKLSALLDLEVKYSGHGYVVKQSITKDTQLKKGDVLNITMQTTERDENSQKQEDKAESETE